MRSVVLRPSHRGPQTVRPFNRYRTRPGVRLCVTKYQAGAHPVKRRYGRTSCAARRARSGSRSAAALGLGAGVEGIVGPGVSGVAGAEVLADLEIGRCPEAAEVVGDLHGPEVGTE